MNSLELHVPPLALTEAVAVAMVGTEPWLPQPRVALSGAGAVGLVVTVIGALTAILGVFEVRRAKTTVNRLRPRKARRVVTSSVYRASRDPIHLGISLSLLALANIRLTPFRSHGAPGSWPT